MSSPPLLEVNSLNKHFPVRSGVLSNVRAYVRAVDGVSLRPEHRWRYFHEFSGGQRKRIGIARALAPNPQLIMAPQHPYTAALLSAVPIPDPKAKRGKTRVILKGDVSSPIDPPPGFRFHTRGPYQEEHCVTEPPVLRETRAGHAVACHFPGNF